jgi:hypothetical protein
MPRVHVESSEPAESEVSFNSRSSSVLKKELYSNRTPRAGARPQRSASPPGTKTAGARSPSSSLKQTRGTPHFRSAPLLTNVREGYEPSHFMPSRAERGTGSVAQSCTRAHGRAELEQLLGEKYKPQLLDANDLPSFPEGLEQRFVAAHELLIDRLNGEVVPEVRKIHISMRAPAARAFFAQQLQTGVDLMASAAREAMHSLASDVSATLVSQHAHARDIIAEVRVREAAQTRMKLLACSDAAAREVELIRLQQQQATAEDEARHAETVARLEARLERLQPVLEARESEIKMLRQKAVSDSH